MRIHYGAGHDTGPSWQNFDVSPMLRIERMPAGLFVKQFFDKGPNFPAEVQYGDITKGMMAPKGSVDAVFASHVIEHLSYDDAAIALENTFGMLRSGGIFRLVVPDLEWRARLYIQDLDSGNANASAQFLRQTLLGHETRPKSLVGKARQAFGGSAHLWMWDELAMADALRTAGFTRIRRCDFGDATDPAFSELELAERFLVTLDDGTQHRELAMEAIKS